MYHRKGQNDNRSGEPAVRLKAKTNNDDAYRQGAVHRRPPARRAAAAFAAPLIGRRTHCRVAHSACARACRVGTSRLQCALDEPPPLPEAFRPGQSVASGRRDVTRHWEMTRAHWGPRAGGEGGPQRRAPLRPPRGAARAVARARGAVRTLTRRARAAPRRAYAVYGLGRPLCAVV